MLFLQKMIIMVFLARRHTGVSSEIWLYSVYSWYLLSAARFHFKLWTSGNKNGEGVTMPGSLIHELCHCDQFPSVCVSWF